MRGRVIRRIAPSFASLARHWARHWGTTMEARKLIDGASYGPEALKAIGQAFDEAWTDIAGNFGHDAGDIERARLRLANALLSIASEDSRDAATLKRAALQRMALDYRRRRPPSGS
jgi:hypothetical protein